jgi:DNA-binding transcriptional MerR regulator
LNIEVVARRTGVPAATLRKWEQRYGVLRPARTAGHHRRYSERDVLRVLWLRDRLADGYRIGEAARLLGGADLDAAKQPGEAAEQLIAACREVNPRRIARSLDLAFELFGPQRAIEEVVRPALERVGELWHAGGISAAAEHHLSEQVLAKLFGLLDGLAEGVRGSAVVCCAPGERHECGPLALGVLLQADGWRVVYLGADTPIDEAAALARGLGARALCVGATLVERADEARGQLDAIERAYPRLAVLRGGAAFAGPPASEAVARLRELAAT